MSEEKVEAKIDMSELDEAIKKANQLKQLLKEAVDLIGSLGGTTVNNYISNKD